MHWIARHSLHLRNMHGRRSGHERQHHLWQDRKAHQRAKERNDNPRKRSLQFRHGHLLHHGYYDYNRGCRMVSNHPPTRMKRSLLTTISRATWLRKDHPDWINVPNLIISCVSVAVAFIPEGLPVAVTASMTISANMMRKHKILCKSLKTVETLGAVSVICSDKTGTLTQVSCNTPTDSCSSITDG